MCSFNKYVLATDNFFSLEREVGQITLVFKRTFHLFKHFQIIWGKCSDNSVFKLIARKDAALHRCNSESKTRSTQKKMLLVFSLFICIYILCTINIQAHIYEKTHMHVWICMNIVSQLLNLNVQSKDDNNQLIGMSWRLNEKKVKSLTCRKRSTIATSYFC